MLLIEKIYGRLLETDLVDSAEDFSIVWCGKSKSWFAERKHSGRDFSISTAINCLDHIRTKRFFAQRKNLSLDGLLDYEIRTLDQITAEIKEYLLEQHRISEVAVQKDGQQ